MSGIDDRLREELSALLDGVLPEERAAELRRRLETDAALRKEFDELRRTVAAVRALPRERAPAQLRARLERRLAGPPAGGIRRLRRRLAVAAVLALAVAAGVLATRPTERDEFEEARKTARQEEPSPEPPAEEFEGGDKLDVAAAEKEGDRPLGPDLEAPRDQRPPEEVFRAGKARLADAEEERQRSSRGAEEASGLREEAAPRARDEAEPARAPEQDLFAQLERGNRLAAKDRKTYLLRLNQMSARMVEAHLAALSVVAPRGAPRRMATAAARAVSPPQVVNLTVADLDEARQIYRVLLKYPGAAGRAATGFVAAADDARQLTAEVEVSPRQWRSVGTWLQLMNVAREKKARRGTRVKEEGGRGAPAAPPGTAAAKAKRAEEREEPEAEAAELAKESEAADTAQAKRKVQIRIRYAPPPRPEKR
ncbi:MAG: anti-sigma factor family protein [Planctomycetota bacterium]